MAAMMILMILFLLASGPGEHMGGHMGSHGADSSPSQTSQSHEHDAAKLDAE